MCDIPNCTQLSAPGRCFCYYHLPEVAATRRKRRFAEQDARKAASKNKSESE